MSKAETLLNSLTDEQIAAYSANAEEPHIVIGSDRYITVPESLKRIAVENDHNVETVTFDCPRYWDGRDLSEMIIYINCKLPDGSIVGFIAENMATDGDILHFDWTITRTIAQIKGSLAFLVCAKQTNSEGNEERHWNSELNTEMYISEGLEADTVIEGEYPDIVNQLLERMTVNEGYYSEIQTLTATATTAASTASAASEEAVSANEQVQASADEIRNSYANAIKGNAKGEIVRVDDVSPLEHDVDIIVHGKNLLEPVANNVAGKVWQCSVEIAEDGKIMLTNTQTSGVAYARIGTINFKKGKTYVYSRTNSSNILKVMAWYTHTTTDVLALQNGVPFTLSKDVAADIAVYMSDISTIGNTSSIYIQIEECEIATAYEPYIDPSTILVSRYGKNLLNLTNCSKANCTISGNGIKANVTDLYYCELYANYLKSAVQNSDGKAITFSVGNTVSGFYIGIVIMYTDGTYAQKTGTNTSSVTLRLDHQGRTVQHVIIRPLGSKNTFTDTTTIIDNLMVEFSDSESDFEEYRGEGYTPNSDGTVEGVTSLSSTMTILTNTDSATVECEYNRDTTKMVESYVLTDEAKSEIVAEVESDMAEVLASLNSYAASVISGGDS